MTTAIPTALTLGNFLKLPETKPASEFIHGHISQKIMPQGKHSRLQLKFCHVINLVAETEKIALAFPELRCTFGGRSIVPDATVFSWERIALDAEGEVANAFEIYPDWTVEILSPDQKSTKVISNILHCLKYGTQLGWLIDPEERSILAFIPRQTPIELTGERFLAHAKVFSLGIDCRAGFWLVKSGLIICPTPIGNAKNPYLFKKMKITILTIGSRGDVQPYAALGVGLQQAGHQVRIATSPIFEPWLRSYGFDFAPIHANPQELVTTLTANRKTV